MCVVKRTGASARLRARVPWAGVWAAVLAWFGTAVAGTEGPRLAITIDDLPFVNAVKPGDSRIEATGRILSSLTAHDVPATGFVVCDRIGGQEEILQRWMDAGMELGNHSCSHP
ncbi:polysaccharide deacetylase family protein, partial [Candidatus Fermentibacteria bacterium]|nr:polysaccharide deacetylase family protein [Candidatus Fermentibacteria bacterium]